MSTMWFERQAGSPVAVSASSEEPAILMGVEVPDWVRLPDQLGGARVRVTASMTRRCPCGKGDARHLILNEATGIRVAECPHGSGFMWYR